jgi:peptide/nickel transport system ATP-binding protein
VEFATANGPFVAVDNVDLDIRRNEIIGLVGESGSGKSTVALTLMRLLRPPANVTAGRIVVDDEDVLGLDPARLSAWRWKTVSMVLQSAMNALNPVTTIFAQFRDVLARHDGLDRAAARQRAESLFALVGIPVDRLDDFPHQLSGGMRQRTMLALALVLQPRLVIMDEPTTALDVVVQREILDEIVDLKARLGFSILFITHDLPLLSEFADRIAVMRHGALVETGATDQIIAAPSHPYTRQLWQALPRLDRIADMASEPP